jgi:hypothetical protein
MSNKNHPKVQGMNSYKKKKKKKDSHLFTQYKIYTLGCTLGSRDSHGNPWHSPAASLNTEFGGQLL